jgi:putative phosphoribosyl transferase
MFSDRQDAGRQLGARLQHLRDEPVVVLGLPRGGVPVAAEVARALDAPLDVIIVRKLGVPFEPELAMGAIGEDGVRVLNDEVVREVRITDADLARVEARERQELERRARRFRRDQPRLALHGRTAVIVDDGIATGSTARAACEVARAHGAGKVVLAVPVAPRGWEATIGAAADECVAVATPDPFYAIGLFYDDFSQTTDDEVVRFLRPAAIPATEPPRGDLIVPDGATALVLFAHGSGSSRHSPRNRYVADVLHQAGLATLLFDLLTPDEEQDRANVFAIDLLARRLVDATRWVQTQPTVAHLPLGYFGASTGAAAALWAAAELGSEVSAVVSRGGRPDLAGPRLPAVGAATLLIVGARDEIVLDLNRQALARLRCERRLAVVPGATHLFEEPGTLQVAAELARDWFTSHLGVLAA